MAQIPVSDRVPSITNCIFSNRSSNGSDMPGGDSSRFSSTEQDHNEDMDPPVPGKP